jgi:hypothetical protein
LKLVHKATGVEVQSGDTVTDFRNDPATVVGWSVPKSARSTGRILVSVDGSNDAAEYYPNVFECEWVEREDRA